MRLTAAPFFTMLGKHGVWFRLPTPLRRPDHRRSCASYDKVLLFRQRPTEILVSTKTLDNLAYSLNTAIFGIDLYERAKGRTDDTQRMLKDLATAQKELFKSLGYRVDPGD